MTARLDDAAREERLTELLEEFRVRQERQAEALAKLHAATETARVAVEYARTLHDEATRRIKRLNKHDAQNSPPPAP